MRERAHAVLRREPRERRRRLPLPRRITSGTKRGNDQRTCAFAVGGAHEPDRSRRQAGALERGTEDVVDERGDRA